MNYQGEQPEFLPDRSANAPSGEAHEAASDRDLLGRAPDATPDDERLEWLLEQLCLSTLEAVEWDELATLLGDDADAQRRYVEAVHLRELLQAYVSQRSIVTAGGTHVSVSPVATPADAALTPRELAPRLRESRYGFGWGQLALATSLALLVGVGGGFYALPFVGGPTRSIVESSPEPRDTTPTRLATPWQAPLVPGDRLGRIVGLSPEASADGLINSPQVGDVLRRGEVVQLVQGIMQIGLSDGATVLAEGPAEFSVMDDRSLFVRSGRIVAQAAGVVNIQTSLLWVECHDAETAVVAEGDTSTTVFNYRGVASVQGNRRRTYTGGPLKVLAATEGVRAEAQSTGDLLLADGAAPDDVYRTWNDVVRDLAPYEQLVLADAPLAYWPLNRVRLNRRVLDLTQHGYDGQAIGNWPSKLADAADAAPRGAEFNGECYIEPDRKPPLSPRQGFTIESWARVEGGPEFQSIFTSRWVVESQRPAQQCFGFTLYAGDDDHWEFWNGSGEYGQNWQELTSPDKLERGKWTHVVATFTPQAILEPKHVVGLVRLYVDGKEVCSDSRQMSLTDFEWPARIGAAEFVPRSLTSWLFKGGIRDVAVYDYAVTPEKIVRHYELGSDAT